jgi:hypothetical protein
MQHHYRPFCDICLVKKSVIFIALLVFTLFGGAQERVTTFGVQFKPLLPSTLLGTGLVEGQGVENLYSVQQRVGYSFGGVVRKGFTKWLSLETGISYVRRNYEARLASANSNFADSTKFRIIGYEIPVSALVFVRLSENVYMDGAFGLALDMYPSDVQSDGRNGSFYQRSYRNSWSKSSEVMPWLNLGLMANVGFEYRTENRGYFYLGASYHLPFRPTYNSFFIYDRNSVSEEAMVQLSGNYLTLDLKYFFHEEPEKRKIPDEELPAWMRSGNN